MRIQNWLGARDNRPCFLGSWDFGLTFRTVADNRPLGSKEQPSSTFPRSGTSSDFRVTSGSDEQHHARQDTEKHKTLTTIRHQGDRALIRDPNGCYQDAQLPSIYQPFKVHGYQSLFIQQFIAAFFNPKATPARPNIWVYELPSVLSAAPSSALLCSIRAATMAHYGKRTGDAAMQREACHWYDKGLENQRLESHEMELQLANGARAADKISEATICAPIMFSLFESLMTTSFTAWAQHMTAAGKMLELRGPEKCQDGIIHHLFRSVRIGSVSFSVW